MALLLAAGPAFADEDVGIGPWRLGMPKEQVVAFAELGPYKDVADGGVETEEAKFSKHKATASFVFADAALRSIEVRVYEGKDWRKAQEAAMEVFDHFAANYGGANVNDVGDNMDRKELEKVVERSLGTAEEMSKRMASRGSMTLAYDMVPRRQPAESRLHAKWVYASKNNTYYVYLYQDRPGAPKRDAADLIEIEQP
jgi:predicted nucleotidyltransferase